MNNTILASFPQNGYAHLMHMTDAFVKQALDDIQLIELETRFNVLHYWNRRWEYPYMMYTIQQAIGEGRVLDAGAGKSMLPFWLCRKGYSVTALDIDDGSFYLPGTLSMWYREQNEALSSSVEFSPGDIKNLDYPDNTFDIVCSMSVLEHVDEPLRALQELWRVLKADGTLSITVDVSLDDTRQLFTSQLVAIREYLDEVGYPLYPYNPFDKDSLTTDWFQDNELEGLPWKEKKRSFGERLRALLRGDFHSCRKFYRPFYSMAVVGLAYRKIGSELL